MGSSLCRHGHINPESTQAAIKAAFEAKQKVRRRVVAFSRVIVQAKSTPVLSLIPRVHCMCAGNVDISADADYGAQPHRVQAVAVRHIGGPGDACYAPGFKLVALAVFAVYHPSTFVGAAQA